MAYYKQMVGTKRLKILWGAVIAPNVNTVFLSSAALTYTPAVRLAVSLDPEVLPSGIYVS